MNIKKMSTLLLVAAVAQVTIASQAFAAGFEKNTMWGAHEAGVVGIATPWVTGADALYYNPAGLVKEKPGHDVSLQVSPLQSTFSGPINYTGDTSTSSSMISTPAALIYDGTIDDKFGFGIGGYTSGGARAQYDDVPIVGANTASVFTNITIMELGVGAGYKVNDALKLGIAWRAVFANVGFGLVQPAANSTGTYVNTQVNDAKGSDFTGFKLGAQYKLSDRTLLGLTFRSETSVKADGTFGGKTATPTAGTIAATPATVKSTFPMQITLGAQHDYEKWRALTEYVWTQYSRVGEVVVEGSPTTSSGATLPANPRVQLHWQDQHAIRLGGEYLGYEWPIRFGYAWTSAVTDPSYARATLAPPAMAHTLSLGSGKAVMVMNNPLNMDAALEYTTSSGSGNGAGAGQAYENGSAATGNYTRAGTYAVNAYALHLGVAYSF